MRWWLRFLRRSQLEEQLERELRFHLDEHENKLISRGYSPEKARREARLAVGGFEQVKENCREARGTRWAEEVLQDIRYAARTLRQKPSFSVITLMILALGIGATSVMFAVVNSVLLQPLPYPESDQLVRLKGFEKDFGEFWGFSYPDLTDLRREIRHVSIAAWTFSSGTVTAPGEAVHVEGRQISAEVLPVLGVVPPCGRSFGLPEDRPGARPVAMISFALWQRRFGSQCDMSGKPLIFDGKAYEVVGVMPARFQLSGEADVYTPLGQSTDPRMQNRDGHFIQVIGRLSAGASLNQIQTELMTVSHNLARAYPKSNGGLSMRVHPLLQEMVSDVRGTLWLLLGAIGLLLLIACVNIASLLLTRSISRERELAMRAALGASRGRIVRQCLTESAVLGSLGGLLGAVVASISVHPFLALWPGSLPRASEIHFDWRVLCFAIAVSLLCGLFFGLIPVLRIPLRRLEQVLRAGGRSVGTKSHAMHGWFVIAEIALALILLVSAGMLGHTVLNLSSVRPGFNPRNVLTARFAISPQALDNAPHIRAAWEEVLARARRLPDVESVALADIIPMREGENIGPYRTTPNPLPPNEEPFALASSVTPDYLKVMGTPLLYGRFFNEFDGANSKPVMVIDENLARHAFGRTDVVGQHTWPWDSSKPVEIVGVVGHVRHWGLAGDDESRVHDQMYYPFAQVPGRLLHFFSSVMSIAVRTRSSPLQIVRPLQQELRGGSGDQTLYEVRTMEELVAASLSRQRFLFILFSVFAGLALLLACTGVYGVLAYITGQRASEIGVRMAIGASAGEIMQLVLWQSLRMTFAGIGIGLVAAFAAGKALSTLVQGMHGLDGVTLAIVTSLLLLSALLASVVPAHRASVIDPIKALRQE